MNTTLFNIEKVSTMLRESGTMSSSRPSLVVNARGDVTKTAFPSTLGVMTDGGGFACSLGSCPCLFQHFSSCRSISIVSR